MPAIQVWPPQPEVASSWTFSGVASKPPKSKAVSVADLYLGNGVRSRSKVSGSNSFSSGEGDLGITTIVASVRGGRILSGATGDAIFEKAELAMRGPTRLSPERTR